MFEAEQLMQDIDGYREEIKSMQEELSRYKSERDCAVQMIADWCDAINKNGISWDDWYEYYNDAAFRPCLIRELIDAAMDGGDE